MTIAHVQSIGVSEYSASASTTTVLSVSKTITAGSLIVVGLCYYGTLGSNESAVDNLGNTYTFREHTSDSTSVSIALLTAPVTTAGTLTSITVTHSSKQYRTIMAAEFSGVGSYNALGGGLSGSGTTSTWCDNKSINANGFAVGVVGSNASGAFSAGSASGSPSTSISLDDSYESPGSASMSMALLYAIAGGSAVTGFSGTATHASQSWAGAGAIFDVSATAAVSADPMGMMGFFGV